MCQVACEVPSDGKTAGSFIAEEWIDKKELKKLDEFIKYSLAAGEEAFRQSKLISIEDPVSFRSGCIIGSGMGGLPGIEQTSIDYANGKKISPFFITGRIINMPAGYLSIKYNLPIIPVFIERTFENNFKIKFFKDHLFCFIEDCIFIYIH